MITKKKIKIYDKYAGEIEGLQLIGNTNEQKSISEQEWNTIDSFINDLEMIKNKLVTNSYKDRTYLKINNNVEKDAIDLLNKIANN